MTSLPKSFYMWAASEDVQNAGYWSEMPPDGGGNPSTTRVTVLTAASLWQPGATAPKDGTWILVQLGQITDGRHDYWSGRCFVVRHGGVTTGGLDMGWHLFPGFSCGDEWIERWTPFCAPEAAKGQAEP